ncbi:MAG TPA: isoprenylcysteine carboxylmethyltransferase family protein [Chthoniobacteraceae bacterium]|jgi:protein-S-isoprenylcysteine O-methyltransferase Ste14|nr:isoprenylcysteine carboxylmethyltransferase family protein [Chthoniobacteraceae bacterium]
MFDPTYDLPIVSVIVIVAMRLKEMGTNRDIIHGRIYEQLTFRLLLSIGTAIAVGSVVEYCLRRSWMSWPCFFLGWIFALSAFAIRRRAIAALGKFWSLHVEIRPQHEFVHHGPFRFVRHPAYATMVLELLALTTLTQAWFTMLAIPLLYAPVLYRRIRLEETALTAKFGEVYAEYRRTTPALIPKPW